MSPSPCGAPPCGSDVLCQRSCPITDSRGEGTDDGIAEAVLAWLCCFFSFRCAVLLRPAAPLALVLSTCSAPSGQSECVSPAGVRYESMRPRRRTGTLIPSSAKTASKSSSSFFLSSFFDRCRSCSTTCFTPAPLSAGGSGSLLRSASPSSSSSCAQPPKRVQMSGRGACSECTCRTEPGKSRLSFWLLVLIRLVLRFSLGAGHRPRRGARLAVSQAGWAQRVCSRPRLLAVRSTLLALPVASRFLALCVGRHGVGPDGKLSTLGP